MALHFSSIDKTFDRVVNSKNWQILQDNFNNAKLIFLVGNGGNLAVSDHASIDISRLTDKVAMAPGSGIIASSIINEKSHENWLEYWSSMYLKRLNLPLNEILIIGFSSSGNSKNVVKALKSFHKKGASATLISAVESTSSKEINTVTLSVNEYHTSEVCFLLLTYALIEGAGFCCPEISKASPQSASKFDYSY